jgi:putative ABC transport system substrate-binding protein
MRFSGIKRCDENKKIEIAGFFASWIILCLTLCVVVIPCNSLAGDGIAVVISKKIKPYIQIGDGIVDGLSEGRHDVDIFILDPEDDAVTQTITSRLTANPYKLVAAVGPEAAVLLGRLDLKSERMYTAVLDPNSLTGGVLACGISLRIPVHIQIQEICQRFENIKKVGLIFDPRFNQWFYEQARLASLNYSLEIVPIQVTARHQIPGIMRREHGDISAVWMIPDQTVISEKIIQYVIKQGIYHGIGVIGYNSFFTRSGSLFSFEFDYTALGHQAALKITDFLVSGECRPEPPVFKTVVNEKIADKTGIMVRK